MLTGSEAILRLMVTVAATSLQPDVDVSQASRHLELLHHDAPGFASIVLLGNARHERHCFFATGDLVDSPGTYDESREALQDVVDNRWNVYTAMSTFTTVPVKGRGTRADVLSVPGVWADLDVKPDVEGYFATEDDLLTYMGRLPKPTLEIASGSGGRHLYWLTHERLEIKDGQALLLAWLDFLRAEAGTNVVENVHDTTRVLRLAGTVRWPKVADDTTPMPRRVVLLNEGPRYRVDELNLLAHDAHVAARQRRSAARERYRVEQRERRIMLGDRTERADLDRNRFNRYQAWEPLLLRDGWSLHSDSDNCRYWTRPGKSTIDGKSASTDFTDETGVTSQLMTIYTQDDALQSLWENADSHDSVGVCSKSRFAQMRLFGGSEKDLLLHLRRYGKIT